MVPDTGPLRLNELTNVKEVDFFGERAPANVVKTKNDAVDGNVDKERPQLSCACSRMQDTVLSLVR